MLSTHFVSDLQEELKYKKAEVIAIKDQLALMDVKIDRYDTIIENIDKQVIPLFNEINVAISSVKTAYDNRISAKCRSNLYWEVTSTTSYTYEGQTTTTTTYTCKKNPATRINYGYYGLKYYRKPQNQDYGANIVREFSGSISAGSTILAVFGEDGTSSLLDGDLIVDNIDSPIVFESNNLPSIVGFGTTTVAYPTIDFEGVATFGSNIIGGTGAGSTLSVNIGDFIILPTLLKDGTKVVGFGTTSVTIDNVWDPGSGTFISTTAASSGLIISLPAEATGFGTFKIGPPQDYPALFLSTSANITAVDSFFTDIRNTQTSYTEFDYSNNPIDPVTIGIIDANSVGYGHTVRRVNNGAPKGPFQWEEVMTASFANKPKEKLNESEKYLKSKYKEPKCGFGSAVYYVGDFSWPIIISNVYSQDGALISSSSTYATEGTQVVVGSGSINSSTVSTTSVKPPGAASNSQCTNVYDAAIPVAESNRDAVMSRNLSKIDALIASSLPLREVRDTLESRAFSMLQGRIYGDVEINNLKKNIKAMQSADYTPFEPQSHCYVVENGKYNSSSIGVSPN